MMDSTVKRTVTDDGLVCLTIIITSLYIIEIENSFNKKGKKEQEQPLIVSPLKVRINQNHIFINFPS